jgi:hypothetical protein
MIGGVAMMEGNPSHFRVSFRDEDNEIRVGEIAFDDMIPLAYSLDGLRYLYLVEAIDDIFKNGFILGLKGSENPRWYPGRNVVGVELVYDRRSR